MSYIMDRAKPGVTKSQKGFFDYVVRPFVTTWIQLKSRLGSVALTNPMRVSTNETLASRWIECFPSARALAQQMETNVERWKALENADSAIGFSHHGV